MNWYTYTIYIFIGIHMIPPSWNCLPPLIPSHPSRLSQSIGLSTLSHTANFHWLSILHMIIYMFQHYCFHLSHPLLPRLCSQDCSLCLSPSLSCKKVHQFHLSRFHICALIYDICFSLSDLLHSVWQSVGPFVSANGAVLVFSMAEFIPLYVCTTSSLSTPLLVDIWVASMSWLL